LNGESSWSKDNYYYYILAVYFPISKNKRGRSFSASFLVLLSLAVPLAMDRYYVPSLRE
jgi:hypothetical protein